MKTNSTKFYCLILIMGLALQMLFPIWKAQSYSSYETYSDLGADDAVSVESVDTINRDLKWFPTGTFAIGPGFDYKTRSPAWNPPVPSNPDVPAKLRTPFQSPVQPHYIELDLAEMFSQLTVLMLIAGFVVWVWEKTKSATLNPFTTVVFFVSICLTVGWLVLGVLYLLSSGYAMVDSVFFWTLGVSLIVGIGFGLWFLDAKQSETVVDQQ